MKKHDDFGLLFWIHLILILLVWASPFLLGWKVILFFIILYYVQITLFKECLLSREQFNGKKERTIFYHYYLGMMGIKVDKENARIFVDYVVPWIIFILAIVLQIVFKFKVLIG